MKNNCNGSFDTPYCSWNLVTDNSLVCSISAKQGQATGVLESGKYWAKVCKWETETSSFGGDIANPTWEVQSVATEKGGRRGSREDHEWVERPLSEEMEKPSTSMLKALDTVEREWMVRGSLGVFDG
jgi:hypothetical protein